MHSGCSWPLACDESFCTDWVSTNPASQRPVSSGAEELFGLSRKKTHSCAALVCGLRPTMQHAIGTSLPLPSSGQWLEREFVRLFNRNAKSTMQGTGLTAQPPKDLIRCDGERLGVRMLSPMQPHGMCTCASRPSFHSPKTDNLVGLAAAGRKQALLEHDDIAIAI